MEFGELSDVAKTLLGFVEAGALAMARLYGFVLVFPLFSWLGVTGTLQAAISLGLAIPLIQPFYLEIADATTGLAGDLPAWFLTTLIAKELLIGVVLGVLLGAPFWAAEVAGGYVDYYRGAALSGMALARPEGGQMLTTGAAIQLLLLAIFVSTGGLRDVIEILYRSYAVWPALEPTPRVIGPLSPFVIALLKDMFILAAALAAPLLIVMALADAALALASRMSPRLNVFDASLSAKTLAMLALLPLYFYAFGAQYADVTPKPAPIGARLLDAARRPAPRAPAAAPDEEGAPR